MHNSQKHHFVPKWYLEGFADQCTGFLDIYDKILRKYRRQKPEKVMKINNYYKQEWASEGIDPYILETLSSAIEAQSKHAFQ